MADLKNITAQVKEILEKDKDARNSDNLLYLRVYEQRCKEICLHPWALSTTCFLENMQSYGFPPFESVRRARQKVQQKYPELSANKAVQAMRAEKQREYLDYARGDAP